MIIFFEILKIIFFLLSVIMGVFFMRGYYYAPDSSFNHMNTILLPGYLLIVGLMVGYARILFLKSKSTEPIAPGLYVKGFIIGLVVGVLLALLYIFAH